MIDIQIEITGNHDHVPDPTKIEMKQSLSEVRWRSSQSRDTPRLINQETQTILSEEAVAELPSYSSVQPMIQRKRKPNNVPIPNPAMLKEINVPEELRRTLRGDVFLMHDSGPDDHDVFNLCNTRKRKQSNTIQRMVCRWYFQCRSISLFIRYIPSIVYTKIQHFRWLTFFETKK